TGKCPGKASVTGLEWLSASACSKDRRSPWRRVDMKRTTLALAIATLVAAAPQAAIAQSPTRPDPAPDCTAADLRDPGARERCKAGEPDAPLQADPKFQATGEGNAHALGEASTAAGSDAYAEAAHSTAIGSASSAHGVGASALGSGSLAQQVDATAVGMNAVAWGRNST